jgi:hypothetical protein
MSLNRLSYEEGDVPGIDEHEKFALGDAAGGIGGCHQSGLVEAGAFPRDRDVGEVSFVKDVPHHERFTRPARILSRRALSAF